jgi:hypothetical protein
MLVIMPSWRSTRWGSCREPGAGTGLQRASCRLHRAPPQAATATGADAEVPGAVNVAMPGGKLLVPAVVVVVGEAVGDGHQGSLRGRSGRG